MTAAAGKVRPEPEPEPGSRRKAGQILEAEFKLAPGIEPGRKSFRVVTPGGVSNALSFCIHGAPSVIEQSEPHDVPRQAQPIGHLPVAVHGRIAEQGEVDFYSFHAGEGEELRFETFSSDALDPGVALFELTGSWFDPDRATRLAFNDELVAYPGSDTEAALTYRFAKASEYLVRVNGFWGHGGPDQAYVLLVSRADSQQRQPPCGEHQEATSWTERSWTRELSPEHMQRLWSRTAPPAEPAGPIPVIDADAEPTRFPVEPPLIPLPALIEGTIGHPGDIDRVRFAVEEGDQLAFEVQTPEKTIPLMNPYLRVVDSEGVEALTNVYSRINANGNISKQIQPKTQYAFPRGGEFTLEIRDITAAYGGREMRYRVLVRPQVPHLGEVRVAQDRLNLFAGEAQKLTVVTDQEEGYDGYAVLTLEGLPPGVRAVMATEVEPDAPPPFNVGKQERFTTLSQKATFVLIPEANAPATPEPVKSQVYAQPVVNGKLGPRILAKEVWVMVLPPDEAHDEPAESAEAR